MLCYCYILQGLAHNGCGFHILGLGSPFSVDDHYGGWRESIVEEPVMYPDLDWNPLRNHHEKYQCGRSTVGERHFLPLPWI